MRELGLPIKRELTVGLDSSGEPEIHSSFSTCGVWVPTDKLLEIGSKLQTIRDVHSCDTAIHYTEIRRESSQASVARDWLRLALKCPDFPLIAVAYVVICDGFDLRFYGNSRQRAVNRYLKTALLGGIGKLNGNANTLSASVLLDAHPNEVAGHGEILGYLADSALYRTASRRDIHARLAQVQCEPIPRSPLAPRGTSGRAKQDLVALADVISGAARGAVDSQAISNVRGDIVGLLKSRKKSAEFCGWSDSPIEISVLTFPGPKLVALDEYLPIGMN